MENGGEEDEEKLGPPRIRFVQISDLCLAQNPWNFVPLLANAFQSMVFRYQDMAEKVFEESHLFDTVVIRPGDLVDEERPDGVSLQVDSSDSIPNPAIVGREDVAALAVASTLVPARHFARPNKRGPKPTLPNLIFVAIPVYLMLAVFVTSLLRNASGLAGGNYGARVSQVMPAGVAARLSSCSAFLWSWLTRIVGRVAPWMLRWKYRAVTGAEYISI
jgi:hypothetical protein